MPEKNHEWSGKVTNGKKQKCTTHICEPAGCPFPWGAYVARTTPAGAQIETGGRNQGGLEGRVAGHSRDGHGDCELWINCHRVFDLWCLCRFVALRRLALSFFFFTCPGWRDLFPLPLPSQGDSSLFGRHPFLLFFLRFAFVWLIVLDRARFQRTASPSLSFSSFLFLQQRLFSTNIFLFFTLFIFSLSLSFSPFLLASLSNDSANNNINVHGFVSNVPFHADLRFYGLSILQRKVNDSVWHGGLSGCQRPYDSGIKIFQSAEVPW